MTGGRSTSISTVVLQSQWVIFPSGWDPAPPLQVSCLGKEELLQLIRPHPSELRCLCCLSSLLTDKCQTSVGPLLVKICFCVHPLSALWAWLSHMWKRTSENFLLARFAQAQGTPAFGLFVVLWAWFSECMSSDLGHSGPLPLEKEGSFVFALSIWEETTFFRVFFSPILRTAQNLWGGVGTATAGELRDEGTMTRAKSSGQQAYSQSYLLLTGPGKCFYLDLVAPNCYPFSLGLEYLFPHKGKVKMLLNCSFLSLQLCFRKQVILFPLLPSQPPSLPLLPSHWIWLPEPLCKGGLPGFSAGPTSPILGSWNMGSVSFI